MMRAPTITMLLLLGVMMAAGAVHAGRQLLAGGSLAVGFSLPFTTAGLDKLTNNARLAAILALQDRDALLHTMAYDSACNATLAAKAVNDLADQGYIAIFGELCSGATLAAAKAAAERKVVLISAASTSPQLTTDGGPFFFRTVPSDAFQGRILADIIAVNKTVTKLLIVHGTEAYGAGVAGVLNTSFHAAVPGATVTMQAFSGTLSEPVDLSGKPDAVALLTNDDPSTVNILTSLATQGFHGPKYGADAAYNDYILANAGAAAEGLILTSTPFGEASFLTHFSESWGFPATQYSAQSYDAMRALYAGYSAAKKKHSKVTGSALAKAVRNVTFAGASGPLAFDENGDPTSASYDIYQVIGGAFVFNHTAVA